MDRARSQHGSALALRPPAARTMASAAAAAAAAAKNQAAASVDRAIDASDNKSCAAPVPAGFRVLSEGSANMLFPADGNQVFCIILILLYSALLYFNFALLFPADGNQVFYNNAQIFNRDLSVMVAKLFLRAKRAADVEKMKQKAERRQAVAAQCEAAGKPVPSYDGPTEVRGARVLDALSASGLRAVRYAKELEDLSFLFSYFLIFLFSYFLIFLFSYFLIFLFSYFLIFLF
eukprot:SAG31_NODE_13425_length_870_cov_1.158236_1_plen_232_part_10